MNERSLEMLLGGLSADVKNIGKQVVQIRDDMKESQQKADQSRANVHRRLDEYGDRTAQLENAIKYLGDEVGDMKSVTDDVVAMREQARGAGSLGMGLLRVGKYVLAFAGWAVGVYYYFTGRPPP